MAMLEFVGVALLVYLWIGIATVAVVAIRILFISFSEKCYIVSTIFLLLNVSLIFLLYCFGRYVLLLFN